MGTHSITLLRERSERRNSSIITSVLSGPTESQYFYEYYICIYQRFDGYVEDGVGEWLANWLVNFLFKFALDIEESHMEVDLDTGLLGTKLIQGFFSMSEYQLPRIIPIESLEEEIFQNDYEYVYIITYDYNNDNNDKTIMLSVCSHKDFIITARPEKFMEKYRYYKTQTEEMKKSFTEIDYDDEEVEKGEYLSEDQLFIEFLQKLPTDV